MQSFNHFLKMLIVTLISIEAANELTVYAILYQKLTKLYRRELAIFHFKCTKN